MDIQGESDADLFIRADLTQAAQVRDLYAQVARTYGRIDILFNNAGIALAEDGSVLDTDAATFNRVMEANVLSVFLCCKYGLPYLEANRRLDGEHRGISAAYVTAEGDPAR